VDNASIGEWQPSVVPAGVRNSLTKGSEFKKQQQKLVYFPIVGETKGVLIFKRRNVLLL